MGVYLGGPTTVDDYSAMQGPCPDGFHVPLNTEWQAIYNIRTALGGGSSDGTNFGKALKLPFAGNRNNSSAGVSYQDTNGNYWSSSRRNTISAYYLYFYSGALNPQNSSYRAYGFSVRCFKDEPVIPTSSWTKLYGTSIESGGIFWSSTDGLISLSSDGQNWITIADKNLGATTVRNSGDTLSETNCGKYYQRGNNYGFPRTGNVTNSSTRVNASNYGPGNYYSSSTFIKYNGAWDTSDNGNLWGGVTGVQQKIVYKEMKNAYIGEYIGEITETYTIASLSGGTRLWTSNLYKSGYKITKIVQEGTITCTSSNEARQGIFNDTSQTLGMQSYYGFNAYKNAPEAIEKHYNNTWYRMQTLSSSYYSTTVNFRRETTATQIKTSYNGNTMTYDLTSEEVGWFKPILEGNSVYCTSQISNYGGSPLGTISAVTVTVTYEKI